MLMALVEYKPVYGNAAAHGRERGWRKAFPPRIPSFRVTGSL
jgi:hypothetical protein